MGKVKSFNLFLTDKKAVYKAGEIMSGIVQVELSQPLKMHGIRVQLRGEAYVCWEETETKAHPHVSGSGHVGVSASTHTEKIKSKETYCDKIMTVWGKKRELKGAVFTLLNAVAFI